MPAVSFRSLIGIRRGRLVDDGDVGVQLRVEPFDSLEEERGQLGG
jgi:hypothetical protein